MKLLLGNSLVKNTAIYTFSDAINKAIPFLVLPIIVRYLTPEDYGVLTNYAIIVQILTVFVYGAAQGSIPVYFFKFNKKDFRDYVISIFSIAVVVSSLFSLLMIIFHGYLESLLSLPGKYLFMTIFDVQIGAFTCVNMLLWRCEEKPFKFGTYQIIQTILCLSLTIWLVVGLKQAWEGKLWANFISTVLMGLTSLYILIKRNYFLFKFSFKYYHFIAVYSIPLIPHALALWGKTGIDKIFITNIEGLEENGLYSTAITWVAIVSLLIGSFGNAFSPYVFKKLAYIDKCASKEEQKNTCLSIVRVSYMFLGGLFVLTLVLTIVFHFLILIIYPVEYHRAVIFLPWLMLGEFFRGVYLVFVNYIHHTLNTRVLGLITFSLSAVQVALSYVLIINLGTIGAALSTCVVSFFTAICVGLYSNKIYPMPWLLKS